MKRTSKKKSEIKKNIRKEDIKQTKSNNYLLKYLFLILLMFSIADDLFASFSENGFLTGQMKNLITIFAVILGIISLFSYKNQIQNRVNNLFSEQGENQNFLKKTKNIFSKKELPATLIFILVLVISIFTLFHNLGNFDIFSDEVQVSKGAAGYYHTGEFRQWDFIKEELVGKPYQVAKPHQWIVAQSYKLFGENAFAARFPSAFFGIILIIFLFFLGRYFIKDTYAALTSALIFALYFEFLFLGRWSRMYGMVYPMFFLLFYWTYKLISEECILKIFKTREKSFLNKYFNYKYIYLPFILILVYIGINTHTNITVLFLIFFVYLLVHVLFLEGGKKYIPVFLLASLILVAQIIFQYKINFKDFTYFESDNSPVYNSAFFGYPFSIKTNIILLSLSFFLLIFVKNNTFKKNYLLLFTTAVIPWIFFSFVIKYAPSYRYVSFLTPFSVLLIVGSFFLINKVLFNKVIRIIMALLIVTSAGLSYAKHYQGLYAQNIYSPVKASVAEKVIINNIKPGDVIFKHWGPKMYMKGIPKDTKFYKIGSYKGKDIQTLFKMMSEHSSGWLTWYKIHEARLDQKFVTYCNLYFKKYAGYGIDNFGEEIYYYDKNMLQPLELFNFQQYLPAANLNLKNSYSFVFDLKINNKTDNSIFYLRNDSIIDIDCFVKNNNLIIKNSDNDSIFISLPENRQNQIIWSFNPKKSILYLNGNKLTEKTLKSNPDLVKFQISTQFNGYIDNIRIYDFNPDAAQIKAIANDKNISEELTAKNKPFRTLFLWKQKK